MYLRRLSLTCPSSSFLRLVLIYTTGDSPRYLYYLIHVLYFREVPLGLRVERGEAELRWIGGTVRPGIKG